MKSRAAIVQLTLVVWGLAGGLVVPGCGGNAGATPDAGHCPRHWTVSDTKAPATFPVVSIASGALTIALPLGGDELVAVTHDDALTGDFELVFAYEAFMPGKTAAYLQAAAHVDDPALPDSPLIGAGIGVDDGTTNLRALLLYADPAATTFDVVPTTSVKGTLRVARAAQTITVTSTDERGASATTASDVSAAPATIGLQFASGAATAPTDDASVRLTDFHVTGGGGTIASDAFDCDSLL